MRFRTGDAIDHIGRPCGRLGPGVPLGSSHADCRIDTTTVPCPAAQPSVVTGALIPLIFFGLAHSQPRPGCRNCRITFSRSANSMLVVTRFFRPGATASNEAAFPPAEPVTTDRGLIADVVEKQWRPLLLAEMCRPVPNVAAVQIAGIGILHRGEPSSPQQGWSRASSKVHTPYRTWSSFLGERWAARATEEMETRDPGRTQLRRHAPAPNLALNHLCSGKPSGAGVILVSRSR